MPYVTQAELETLIPPSALVDGLDDDRDGRADADLLANIFTAASNAVDAYLAGLYTVPFATPSALVKEAARVFAAEMVFSRRLSGDDRNPWKTRADGLRDHLAQIRDGKLTLDAADAADTTAAYGGNTVVPIRIR